MKKEFSKYLAKGLNLIALAVNSKNPIHKAWGENPLDELDAFDHVGNVGFTLGENHLVLDIDPRNGGDVSVKRLFNDLGLNLKPTVHTAGGGQHYYLTIPAQFIGRKFHKELLAYGGIDFLTKGRFVVAAGSEVDGRQYRFEDDLCFVEAPLNLLNLYVREELDEGDAFEKLVERDALSEISEQQVREWLFKIDPNCSYEKWMKVGMALQTWNAGDLGLKLLDEWSQKSTGYDRHEIEYKWRKGYSAGELGGYTIKTLAHLAQESDYAQKESKVTNFLEKVKVARDSQTLEFDLAKEARKMNLSGIDAERVAKAFQAQLKEIHKTSVPIAQCRELIGAKRGSVVIEESCSDVPQWCKDWIFINARNSYLNLTDGAQYKSEGFNLVNGKFVPMGEGGGKQSAAKYCADNGFLRVVEDTMYLPQFLDVDEPNRFLEYNGKSLYNAYEPKSIPMPSEVLGETGKEMVERLEKHLSIICNGDGELTKILMEWIAFQVQFTGRKILWSPVIQSIQGLGKSFIGQVLRAIMGAENVGVVAPDQVRSSFNSWACDVAVNVLEELRVQGANRYEILNGLKPLITDSVIQINEKGVKQLTKLNVTNYICFTNYRDALPLEKDDRRWFIIFNEIENLSEDLPKLTGKSVGDYFEDLYEVLKHGDELRRYFLDYIISQDFLDLKRAPVTDFKKAMIGAEAAGLMGYVETIEVINQHEVSFVTKDILSSGHLFEAVQELYPDLIMTPHEKNRVLKKLGFMQHEARVTLDGKKSQVWSKKRVTEAALKRLREARGKVEKDLDSF